MTIQIESICADQLPAQFVLNAQSAGMLLQKCNSLIKFTDFKDSDDRLPNCICDLFDEILEQKQQCELLKKSLKNLDKIAAQIFEKQNESISDSLWNLEISAFNLHDRIFDAQSRKIKSQFDHAMERLDICKKTPTEENFKAADLEILNFSQRVQNMRYLIKRCSSTLEIKSTQLILKFNQYDTLVQKLEKRIEVYTQIN
jgi:hypothetical protein